MVKIIDKSQAQNKICFIISPEWLMCSFCLVIDAIFFFVMIMDKDDT